MCVRVLLKRHMCNEQLETDDDDELAEEGRRRVLYLVPRFLQYHTELEGCPNPEGEMRA